MKDYDYDRFQSHPIVETDIHKTRDINLFRCILDDYERGVSSRLKDYRTNTKIINRLLGDYVTTLQKIQAYERKAGVNLISYTDSRGKLRQNPSYMSRLSQYL